MKELMSYAKGEKTWVSRKGLMNMTKSTEGSHEKKVHCVNALALST